MNAKARKVTSRRKGRSTSHGPDTVQILRTYQDAQECGKSRVRIDTGADPLKEDAAKGEWDLDSPHLYLNRELTWLNFNRRVLWQAESDTTPLLERCKFHAIVSSNTDDFVMKRIGGLKQLVEAEIQEPSIDGRTPMQQLHECYRAIKEIEDKKSELFEHLLGLLKKNGIEILPYSDLADGEKTALREHFRDNIYPLVTPQSIGPAHPFPFISNLSLNLLVTLSHSNRDDVAFARVKVPVGQDLPRFVQVGAGHRFVRLEEIIKENLDILFPEITIVSAELFRVTRNVNTEKDEDKADDLLELIESELRDRKFAPIVRLQVSKEMDPVHLGMICADLALDETHDIFEINGMIGKRDLIEIANLNIPEFQHKSHHPIDPPRLKNEPNIFHTLKNDGPILLYHPYESFSTSVERFLREASRDPKVRAIKMVLYRTSVDTQVVNCLIDAVQNGKQVAVVIELKARFDEAANIRWASQLEEMGIHVTYGVIGFKTHAKVILVVRKDFDGLHTYSHIGTGNYHAGTARLYTDLGMLICDPEIGRDLTELFNFLTTGYTAHRKYQKILMAPGNLKKAILGKIEREIKVHTKDNPGVIQMKMNALEDRDVVRALYAASQKGVKVDLVIRDSCRLRPGVAGLSENIRVTSIVGRFLEHARVYFFGNGGDNEYYIGSADAMRRNLEKRVEVLAPVEDPALKRELRQIIDIQIDDRCTAWTMLSDGSYERCIYDEDKKVVTSQEVLMEIAEKRKMAADKIKRLQTRGKSRMENWSGYP